MGGNAFDATIAAGFAAAVAEPGLTSLGGGGFLLAHPADGEEILFDFFVDTPGRGRTSSDLEPHFTPIVVGFRGADQVFHAGYGSVAVPGCLNGYLHAHSRLGQLELAEVVAPAHHLADEGLVLNEQQTEFFGLLAKIFTLTEDGQRIFTDNQGRLLGVGDRFRNPDLAAFLDDLAAGRHCCFGDPEPARRIDAMMTEHAGLLSAEDLRSYKVIERTPLELTYRGVRISTNPPPSFGGTIVAEALALLEGRGEAMVRTSPEQVDRLARVLTDVSSAHTGGERFRSSKGTTHISVADGDGNVAAMTTSNGSCSGVFVPETGIQLNNIMGEKDLHPDGFHVAPPGLRVGSMMSPTMLEYPDGTIVALGSGGSERIRSAITQVVVNLLDHDMALTDAILSPRIHWDGATLQIEPGFSEECRSRLRARAPLNEWDVTNLYFGGAHAVSTAGDAAGDPRRGGSTAVQH